MPGAPLPLVAVRLAVVGKRAGAARSATLAAPRALAFGSRAAAPRTFGRATARTPCRRRCAPRPGASTLPPLHPCAAERGPFRHPPPSGPHFGRTSASRPPGAGGAAPHRHRPPGRFAARSLRSRMPCHDKDVPSSPRICRLCRAFSQLVIFFIQAGHDGPIKIGKAVDPEKRLQTLQTGTHEMLRLLAVIPAIATMKLRYIAG